MSYHVRDTCRLCDAKLPDERVLDLGNTPLANALETEHPAHPNGTRSWSSCPDYPLFLKQCATCGHVQLPVVVDPKLLFPADYPYQSATGKAMREHLQKMAAELERYIEPDVDEYDYYSGRGPVVEIGSNDGFLLEQFLTRGLAVVGVDPAGDLARDATRRGILTIPEFFTPDVAKAVVNAVGGAGLVVANNVFAHADDLHGIVNGVKLLLGESGVFVFEVGWLADVIRTNNFGTVYAEHMSYHTLAPLVRLFHEHKMTLFNAHPVPTQGGSLRCFVRRNRKKLGKMASAQLEEIDRWERRWCNPAELARWQSRVNFAATMLADLLRSFKFDGKSIAAYGCSAKSTTLLHVAGIGRETIDFICDDAPTKQGKFSPGKHIPIVPGTWLEEKQPDYCVSLSGNFSEAFKAAHPDYRGEWIEPVFT